VPERIPVADGLLNDLRNVDREKTGDDIDDTEEAVREERLRTSDSTAGDAINSEQRSCDHRQPNDLVF